MDEINYNKKIISHCKNYYRIINEVVYKDDNIDSKMITIYKKYIFTIDLNNKEQVESIEKLDNILNSYFDDFDLRKRLNVNLKKMKVKKSEENILKTIVENIIELYDKYIEDYTRNIYIPRWI